MTKIAFISDWNCMSGEGSGAELSEKAVIEDGIKKDYSINLVLPNTPAMNEVFKSDLVIIGNASRFPKQYLAGISERTEYIMYLHDFFPICDYRAFFPDLDKCKKTCPNLSFTKRLLLNSSLNIFLSPLHYKVWCRVLPELKEHPHYLHVSSVDTNVFKPIEGVERTPNSIIGIHALYNFKGKENILKYAVEHPDLTFSFYGGTDDPKLKLPQNCFFVGMMPQEQLPGIYSQAEAMISLPNGVLACERCIIEGKLCGIPKIILNKLVGVSSYKQFKWDREDFAKWIEGSPKRFWKEIEKEVL